MIKNINLFSKPDARNKYGIIAQIAVPLPISIELTYYVNKNSSNPTNNNYHIIIKGTTIQRPTLTTTNYGID